MTLTIDSDELLTILNNQQTAIDALAKVAETAGTGDVARTVHEFFRAMKLIQQSVKSTYSIINEVRSRYELPTS